MKPSDEILKKIRTTATPEHCSAAVFESSLRACAEASRIGAEWWVNRVLVNPKEERNKGLGGALLERLILAIMQVGGEVLLVTPGGYDNDNDSQFRFYLAHGFERTVDSDVLCLDLTKYNGVCEVCGYEKAKHQVQAVVNGKTYKAFLMCPACLKLFKHKMDNLFRRDRWSDNA